MLFESKDWSRAATGGARRRKQWGGGRSSLSVERKRSTHLKKKLKVLALFDAIAPTTIDQDLTAELATDDWKTERNVLEALRALGHTTEYLAIFDDLDLIQQKTAAVRARHFVERSGFAAAACVRCIAAIGGLRCAGDHGECGGGREYYFGMSAAGGARVCVEDVIV